MTLTIIKGYHVAYQRQGNDRNGNPVFLINIFDRWGNRYDNVNGIVNRRTDKYGNIRITSYNIEESILKLLPDEKSSTVPLT